MLRAGSYLIIALFFLPSFKSEAQTFADSSDYKNVLFIGNSITYFHHMPQLLQRMFNENHIKIRVQQSTFSGARLSEHLYKKIDGGSSRDLALHEMPTTVSKIISQNWDIVILQETPVNILIPEQVKYNYEPSLVKFDSIIKSRKGKTLLYQTYSLQVHPVRYSHPGMMLIYDVENSNELLKILTKETYYSDSFITSTQELDTIKLVYISAAKKVNAEIAPVGEAFELCRKKYPELDLFDDNHNHPSLIGAYLIASVFYRSITGKHTATINYTANMDKSIIDKLLSIGDSISWK